MLSTIAAEQKGQEPALVCVADLIARFADRRDPSWISRRMTQIADGRVHVPGLRLRPVAQLTPNGELRNRPGHYQIITQTPTTGTPATRAAAAA